MAIRLYGARTGNSRRASIALEEAGISYSVSCVDLRAGEHTSALMGRVEAERFMIDTPYIAGDRFTLADIAAYTSAFAVRQDFDWSELPLLRAWYARISARPGVVRGVLAARSSRLGEGRRVSSKAVQEPSA